MKYRVELPDLLESVVDDLDVSMEIINHNTDPTTGYITLLMCDLRHAEAGRALSIGGNDYEIKTVNYSSNTLTVFNSLLAPITVSTFDIYPAVFFKGTPIQMINDLLGIPDSADKTPMVYLIMNYQEQDFPDLEDVLDRKSTFKLLFLTQANYNEWETEDFFHNSIKPMSRLRQQFIAALQKDSRFNMIDAEYGDENMVRFGIYQSNKGVEKNLVKDALSGNQTNMVLSIYKDYSCADCSNNELTDESFNTFQDENNQTITA